jgi:hypothetical protein
MPTSNRFTFHRLPFTGLLTAAAAAAFVLLHSAPGGEKPKAAPESEPRYENKELLRPEGFRTWVFVGANIGLRYRKDDKGTPPRESDRRPDTDIGDFHNVYINPRAYEQFKKTGVFPEGTMLVMDVFKSKARDDKGILEKGFFPAEHREFEVAVKNSARPDGAPEPWAYYAFGKDQRTSAPMRKQSCYDCHLKNAKTDNVWVQFYPTLRDAS